MPGKWTIEKAVWLSGMPAPRKTLMAALLFKANSKTGQIPDEYTPSLSELADLTSLGISTVKRELNTLEDDGWIYRHRPSVRAAREEKKRTKYFLAIPKGWKTTNFDRTRGTSDREEDGKDPGARPTAGLADEAVARPTAGHELGPQRAVARPTAGHELGPQRAVARPTAGHKNTNTPNTSSSSARSDHESEPVDALQEEEEEIDHVRTTESQNPTITGIAASLRIDGGHAGRVYTRVLALGHVKAPAKFIDELIRNGDIAKFLDPKPQVIKSTKPKCDFVDNPHEPGWCKSCRMPEFNARHHQVAAA